MAEAHEPGSYLKATLESQPAELTRLLADDSGARAATRLRGCSRIFLAGTGTSFHGALAGQVIVRTVSQEKSPVHTASHTAAMLRIAQVAAALGSPAWQSRLADLPRMVQLALDHGSSVASAVSQAEFRPVTHFVGGGPARATAYEGALKLREASHLVSAEGHDVEGILHGPLVSIQPGNVVVLE